MVTIIFSLVYRSSKEEVPIVAERHLENHRPGPTDCLGKLLLGDALPFFPFGRQMGGQCPLEPDKLIHAFPVKFDGISWCQYARRHFFCPFPTYVSLSSALTAAPTATEKSTITLRGKGTSSRRAYNVTQKRQQSGADHDAAFENCVTTSSAETYTWGPLPLAPGIDQSGDCSDRIHPQRGFPP